MKHKTYTMRVFSIFLVFAYLLCGGFSLVFAQQTTQQQPGRTGGMVTLTVTEVDGPAELLSSTEVERQRGIRLQSELWKPALPRTILNSGDQLRTGPGASMRLQMNDGTVVTLSGDSTVVIEDLRSARGQAPPTTQFLLEKGKISTQQTARILGQTNQIIRTENGSVNISLGEVEVWKPAPETKEYALLAASSSEFPLVTKVDKSENTYVTLNRGTLVVESFGKGQVITDSGLRPETCVGLEKIKLTMYVPKHQVMVAMLEDQNGFRVSSTSMFSPASASAPTPASNENFYLLVGTEGTANKIKIATQDSDAEVDVEGLYLATYEPNSGAAILKHPLMTIGVKSKDVIVNFICDATESKGLRIGDVDVREISGGVHADGTFVGGRDTNRPVPSRGRMGVTPIPPTPTLTPTPTERPEDDDEEEPTPTPEEEEEPVVGGPPVPPAPVPLTYVFSPIPVAWLGAGDTIAVGALGADPSCTANQNLVTVSFRYNDQSMGIYDKGTLIYRWRVFNDPPGLTPPWTPPWTGGAEEAARPPRVTMLNPPVTYTFPAGESGRLQFTVCVDFQGNNRIGFAIQLRNQGGYTSNQVDYPAAAYVP